MRRRVGAGKATGDYWRVNKLRRTVWVLAATLALAVFLGLRWFWPPGMAWNRTWYEAMARDVAAGRLTADARGVIGLTQLTTPPRGAWGYRIEHAYLLGTVTPPPPAPAPGAWTLFIPHWRGKGSNVEGYLYSPGTVGPTASAVWPMRDSTGAIVPAAGTLTIERSLGNGWHLAVYRWD